jgi:hypothetical protein
MAINKNDNLLVIPTGHTTSQSVMKVHVINNDQMHETKPFVSQPTTYEKDRFKKEVEYCILTSTIPFTIFLLWENIHKTKMNLLLYQSIKKAINLIIYKLQQGFCLNRSTNDHSFFTDLILRKTIEVQWYNTSAT